VEIKSSGKALPTINVVKAVRGFTKVVPGGVNPTIADYLKVAREVGLVLLVSKKGSRGTTKANAAL